MRARTLTLLLATALFTGCDDDTPDTATPPGPSSGTTVQPPPPVAPTTPATQPATGPASGDTTDLRDEHRKNYDLPPSPDPTR